MQGKLDLRRLRYFLAIAEHGSLSATARALNVAQPALSYHVSELERICGLSLVLRGRDGIRLTPAGEVLRRHAAGIVSRTDEAERTLDKLARKAPSNQRVRIAIITSLAADLTPLLVERVRQAEQGPTLSIMEAGTRDIEARLARGRIDMAICLAPSPGIDASPIAREELLFIAPHGTTTEATLSQEKLSDQKFVLPAPGNPLRDFIDASADRHGFSTDVVLEVDGLGSRFNAVVNGIGCTLLGAHSIPPVAAEYRLCVVPISPALRRPIYLGRRRGLEPSVADAMEAIIVGALGELGISGRVTGDACTDMM
ncbi:MAG: LysR family transcriptional regulator [Pseudomonadota bacterium]